MHPAQTFDNNLGKIIRLHDDGRIPVDNPYTGMGFPANTIWTLGHRNVLGLSFSPDNELWANEMGPLHGDELNLISKGEKEDDQLLLKLTKDENEVVRSASFGHLLGRDLDPGYALSLKALKEDSFLVARSVLSGLILKDSAKVIELWRNRELDIRPELWLDLYLVLLELKYHLIVYHTRLLKIGHHNSLLYQNLYYFQV